MSLKKAAVASGNIKSIFAKMSKSNDLPKTPEKKEDPEPIHEQPKINEAPVKLEYLVQPFDNRVQDALSIERKTQPAKKIDEPEV